MSSTAIFKDQWHLLTKRDAVEQQQANQLAYPDLVTLTMGARSPPVEPSLSLLQAHPFVGSCHLMSLLSCSSPQMITWIQRHRVSRVSFAHLEPKIDYLGLARIGVAMEIVSESVLCQSSSG